MSLYKVIIKEEAQKDLKKLLLHEPKIYKKAMKFIGELYEHPKTGQGHPEPLKGKPEGRWSRETATCCSAFPAMGSLLHVPFPPA